VEKIVITDAEVAQVLEPVSHPQPPQVRPAYRIPIWARLVLIPSVIFLPLVCLMALLARFLVRNKADPTRLAWIRFFSTLLVVSGLLFSTLAIFVITQQPQYIPILSIPEMIESIEPLPVTPFDQPGNAKKISEDFKSTVFVIAEYHDPISFSMQTPESASFGSGVLLCATSNNYYIATSRHVIDGPEWETAEEPPKQAFVLSQGQSGALATVIARHSSLDLAILAVPSRKNVASFRQAINPFDAVAIGERIYVIGHPEGLLYSITDGLVSQKPDNDLIQLSAAVSPGNSGGPVFDERGRLVGIVQSVIDKVLLPNAENLNFAIRADALLDQEKWVSTAEDPKTFRRYFEAMKETALEATNE
jgi:S1-C subfamily serine protease